MTDSESLLREAMAFIADPDTIEKDPKAAKALSKQLADSDDALAKEAAPYVASAEHGTTREARRILSAIRRRLKPPTESKPRAPRLRDTMYPYAVEHFCGDGISFGCGVVIVTYDITDPEQVKHAHEAIARHRASCPALHHDKAAPEQGRAKKGTKK